MNIHLYTLIPRRLSSAVMYRLARVKTRFLKNAIIRAYTKITGANTDFAAEKDPCAYATLNDFFTRALAAGARPIDADNAAIVSPVDGRCAHYGAVQDGMTLQAKGLPYSIEARMGGCFRRWQHGDALPRPG